MPNSITDINSVQILGDSTPNAVRVISYNIDGTAVEVGDRKAITSGSSFGYLSSGEDYKQSRLIRASTEGGLSSGKDTLLFYDSITSTTIDTNIWLQTLSTMTQTVALGVGRIFNANNSKTSGAFSVNSSTRQFPVIPKTKLTYKSHVCMQIHALNNIMELGFGSPTAGASANIVNGAVWRKNGMGQLYPVLAFNGSEIAGQSIPFDTYFSEINYNEYSIFYITIDEWQASFKIMTANGIIVNEQSILFPTYLGSLGTAHLKVLERCYNASAIPVTPTTLVSPSLIVAKTSVTIVDIKKYSTQQSSSGMSRASASDIDLYTQNANYANSSSPGTPTLVAGTVNYTTLGGQWAFTSINGSEAEYSIFAISLGGFVITRVSISAYNTVAINDASIATLIQWSLGIDSASGNAGGVLGSLGRIHTIGIHSFTTSAPVGASGGPDIIWEGMELNKSGFIQILAKIVIGNHTTQVIRGTCTIEGFYI